LGGHGAPAFDKGADLAKEGYAARRPDVNVTCFVPNPQTTQGEELAIAQLSKKLDWKRIIVVVPTTQATPPACGVGSCYSGQVLEVAFPPQGIGQWLAWIAYEWGARLKALTLQPTC
jgi:hypothetical protein